MNGHELRVETRRSPEKGTFFESLMICDLVVNGLSFPPGCHEPLFLQDTEMLGDILKSGAYPGGDLVH